ncbi:hypothetical protein PSEUDO9AG_41289 [Pseudomonas sp. 9Ag]|nr:hypothetical protein PSEUDO9AG_41289 [Pseudomonas sp. 9Ag]
MPMTCIAALSYFEWGQLPNKAPQYKGITASSGSGQTHGTPTDFCRLIETQKQGQAQHAGLPCSHQALATLPYDKPRG